MLGARRRSNIIGRKTVSAAVRTTLLQVKAPKVALFFSNRCCSVKPAVPMTGESEAAEVTAKTKTRPALPNDHHDPSHGSSLYMPFMGSSSRFTFASPITTISDINALEGERLTHSPPQRFTDHCCIYLVKLLRWCADKLFRERYLHRATMLKVIAPAPPLAGAMISHLRTILKKENPAYIPGKGDFATETRGLLAQAESHASHIRILMLMTEITYVERVAALFLQAIHFAIFALLFLLSPRVAFRLMGYLGEESVVIWTHMINDIDLGKVTERALPQDAIEYWGLHKLKYTRTSATDVKRFDLHEHGDEEATTGKHQQTSDAPEEEEEEEITLRDLILLMRSDEMVWREACHRMADEMNLIRKSSFMSSFLS
ncbi:GTPase activating protein of Rab-like GTPase, putative [Trypanosoma cruzi marinkellei]|uniref:Alternative oxidase n=1 Tax=Trypanosoma cruzi marinkellei TaxID=85056 RepID=K2NBQ1_TRYCR|nr:GTPase activating protein of Rab-like GTPase, putative [Trypanosoma cruzi marinkellei]